MGYNGACRRKELANTSAGDIEYKSDSIIVTVTKTKNNVPMMFAITHKQWIEIIKKYANLPVKNVTHRRFFLTYRNGYCINSPIGINIMGKVSKDIAIFLKLPNQELYNDHCFRRSSVTHLANQGTRN
jgi:integrase